MKERVSSRWAGKAARVILLGLTGVIPFFLISYPTRFRDPYLTLLAAALGGLLVWLLRGFLPRPGEPAGITVSDGGLLTLAGAGLGLSAVILERGFWPYVAAGGQARPALPLPACLAVLLLASLLICADGSRGGRSILDNHRSVGILSLSCLVLVAVSLAAAFMTNPKGLYFTAMKVSLFLGAGACIGAVIQPARSGRQ